MFQALKHAASAIQVRNRWVQAFTVGAHGNCAAAWQAGARLPRFCEASDRWGEFVIGRILQLGLLTNSWPVEGPCCGECLFGLAVFAETAFANTLARRPGYSAFS